MNSYFAIILLTKMSIRRGRFANKNFRDAKISVYVEFDQLRRRCTTNYVT